VIYRSVDRLRTADELRAASADPLILWAAQDMGASVRAWAHGTAVAVAVPDLAGRHRVVVAGAVGDIATLMRELPDGDGQRYRPLGDDDTITALCRELPELRPTRPFGWMSTDRAPAVADGGARLAGEEEYGSIEAVLEEALPGSLAWPGKAGVTRWWVATDDYGVAACAADAWSAPRVGLLAGVATATRARGRGLARRVATTGLAALVAEHGRACLMVDADNTAAQGLYASLGMDYRSLRAATEEGSA
jgi:ribosomal protein S18 acetylase RimI-like enzyme